MYCTSFLTAHKNPSRTKCNKWGITARVVLHPSRPWHRPELQFISSQLASEAKQNKSFNESFRLLTTLNWMLFSPIEYDIYDDLYSSFRTSQLPCSALIPDSMTTDAVFSFIWSESQKSKDFHFIWEMKIWLNAELPFRIMGNQGASTGGDFLWFFGIALENTR